MFAWVDDNPVLSFRIPWARLSARVILPCSRGGECSPLIADNAFRAVLAVCPGPGGPWSAATPIDLQGAGEVAEMRFRALGFPVGGIDRGNQRHIIAAPWGRS